MANQVYDKTAPQPICGKGWGSKHSGDDLAEPKNRADRRQNRLWRLFFCA
jgi:hypothetical protein